MAIFYILKKGGITDANVIIGALLHDTVEDTDTSLDEIEQQFGKDVRFIVDQVTDDKNLEKMERKRLQVEVISITIPTCFDDFCFTIFLPIWQTFRMHQIRQKRRNW